MHTRILSALAACLLAFSAPQAAPISQSEAQRIARQALRSEVAPVTLTSEARSRIGIGRADDASPTFYFFNNAEGDGFALVSGDDDLPLLLGYSPTGTLQADGAGMPEALRAWLAEMDRFVEKVRGGEAEAPARFSNGETSGTPVVGPLCASKWGQDTPYNLLCPAKSGESNAVVGCVATAMSQILYYWQWPATGMNSLTYNATGYGALSVDFAESTYEWDKMKDTYTILDGKKTASQAVAKLCYDCGVACRMQYSVDGSGTQSQYAYDAYATYFRYKASKLGFVYRDCCASQEEFNRAIYDELDAGRPIQCSASSSQGGGADAAGHSYVLDGYDSNGYVHINWGWDGAYNGYYAIPLMDPESYQFDSDQDLIIGIEPDRDGTDYTLPQRRMLLEGTPDVRVESVAMNGKFNVYIDTLWNLWGSYANVEVGVGLYDARGTLQECVTINSTSNTYQLSAFSGRIFSDGIGCRVTGSYGAGDYTLRIVCRVKGYEEWLLPYAVGGQKNNQIPVYIHDNKLYFYQVSSAISAVSAREDGTGARPGLYDLSGRRAKDASHPGIYVRDGRKLLVR